MSSDKSLEKAWENLMDIAERRDVEAASNIITDDILLSVDTNVFRGSSAYLELAGNLWSSLPEFKVKFKNERIEASKDGSLGYIFGEHGFVRADDQSVLDWVHHLYVWKKDAGEWKMAAIHISHPQTN